MIEVMIVLLLSTVLVNIIISILSIMNNVSLYKIDQVDAFRLQFQQLVQRSAFVKCNNNILIFEGFKIYENNNRLIKSPGYEILLEDIREVQFECNFNIKLKGEYKNKVKTFEFVFP